MPRARKYKDPIIYVFELIGRGVFNLTLTDIFSDGINDLSVNLIFQFFFQLNFSLKIIK